MPRAAGHVVPESAATGLMLTHTFDVFGKNGLYNVRFFLFDYSKGFLFRQPEADIVEEVDNGMCIVQGEAPSI